MKKTIIIAVSVLVLVFGSLLLLPLFFKGDIIKVIENQSTKYTAGKLTIGDIDLSLFKDFPNMNVAIKNMELLGDGAFKGDTIARIALFELSINLKSLLVGDNMIINNISLQDALLQPKVNADGVCNWEAAEQITNDESSNTKEVDAEFNFKLDNLSVDNVKIVYTDLKSANNASVENLKFDLKGNLSESSTDINFKLLLQNISYISGSTVLLNQCNIVWDSEIAADMKNGIYSVKRNNLAVNDLRLDLEATIKALGDDRYNVQFAMNAPDTKFESLLTLVPSDYRKYLEGVTSSGEFNFSVKADGDYFEGNLPKIDAIFAIKNGKFKYDKQPLGIEDINVDLLMTNPGGAVDSTVIDLQSASFTIAQNPFSVFVTVVNPLDPYLRGGARGVINFENLKSALPLEEVTLKGVMTTDVGFRGAYKYIETQEYEKFDTKGSLSLKNVLLVTADYPKGIAVESGNLQFTTEKLNLSNLKAKIHSSDFALNGSISNYIPYIFKDGILKGNFTLNSNRLNLNEFATTDKTATNDTEQETKSSVFEIPKNIDFKFNANVANITMGEMRITSTRGNVSLNGGVATLTNLSMNMLDGTVVMNGKYDPLNVKVPSLDFKLNATNFDVKAMYDSFSMVKKSLPMASDCQGKVSARMDFTAKMDSTMTLDMKTFTGQGVLSSRGILINNSSLGMLSDYVKTEEIGRVSISKLDINFKITNGNITIAPFTTMLAGNVLTMSGNQSVAGALDYTLSMNIKREKFGREIIKMLSSVPGSKNVKALDFDVKIGGTLDKPTIKPDISKAINTVTKEAAKELLNSKGGILKGLGIL